MKKKLLLGAAVALFLGTGVFTATSLTQKEQISDLTLANIEAMTFDDGDLTPGSGSAYCTESSNDKCYYNTPNGASGVWGGYRRK